MALVDHGLWERARAAAAECPETPAGWVQGLAYNKAAPAAVIRRIIAVRDRLAFPTLWLTQVELSATVLAELATHPDVWVRREVAGNPHTAVETLTELAADPEPRVRLIALIMANDRGHVLPAPLVVRLADDAKQRIREEALQQQRYHAAAERESTESPDSLEPSPAPPPEPAAPAPLLPTAEAESLVTSPDARVRTEAAWDPRIPRDLALGLAEDPDDTVRLRLSMREDLSDEERQSIPYIVPDGYHQNPPWLRALGEDPVALVRLASSPHVLIRRSVARRRR